MPLISNLWDKYNYLLGIPYLNSNYITEYDLSKANISSLRYLNRIDDNEYIRLYNMEKREREIYIGNAIREDQTIYKSIQEGIIEAKHQLFFENNIIDSEVLSIKNDAVFFIGNRQLKTDFGIFKFSKKNVYTFFMSTTNKLELYYNYDPILDIETIDIKGINDEVMFLHRDYMISFLCTVFYMAQNCTIEDTLKFYNEFYDNFINKRLDVGFYREFDSYSKFRIPSRYMAFALDTLENRAYLENISIDTNLSLLRDIHHVLSDIYFQKTKSR